MHFESLERRRLLAISIQGVQPAALDQPRINAYVRIPGQALPMTADLGSGQGESFNIQAFYDTGASGVLLSLETTGLLTAPGYDTVPFSYAGTDPVIFTDVGVAGSEYFGVSEPLDVGLADFNQGNGGQDLDNLLTYEQNYNQTFSPVRAQLGPVGEEPDPLLGGLDVFGTPLMQDKVVVFDPRPVNTFFDTMRTYVYNPGTPFSPATESTNPGIAPTSRHIKLSYGGFERFTKVTPSTSAGPTLATNPFIGSNPVRAIEGLPPDDSPPVEMTMGSMSATGSFLLDTGAGASILSKHKALELGVRYRAGTLGTEDPILETVAGATLPDQFQLSIGGIGGVVKWAGFFMDDMTVQTVEGESITFVGAPVLVGDISVLDDKNTPAPEDDDAITLDGIFGMNFLVASVFVSEVPGGGFPTLGDLTVNAFDWITYDSVNGLLGLEVADPSPNPRVVDELFDVDGSEHAFYVQFSRDVGDSLSDSDIYIENLTDNSALPWGYISQAWEPQLNTATFSFPGTAPNAYLPDGNYRAIIAADDVDDGTLTMEADYVHDFFFLNGDATRDRKVDTKDFNVLAQNFGNVSGAVFTTGDFNYDGEVDSLDFAKFSSQYGKSLPVPASKAMPAPGGSFERTISLERAPTAETNLNPVLFLSPGLMTSDGDATDAASSALRQTLSPVGSIFSASRINRVEADDELQPDNEVSA